MTLTTIPTPGTLPRPARPAAVPQRETVGTAAGRQTSRTHGRTALLVDLDNIAIRNGSALRPKQFGKILQRIVDAAGAVEYRKAIAPRSMVTRYGAQLAACGIPWELVDVAPNAADHALLDLAAELADHGFTRFVVASADHAFTPLAKKYPTTVMVRAGQKVSHTLRQHATEVKAA